MIKNLLFILFIGFALQSFGQQNSVVNFSASPNPFKNQTTISFITDSQNTVVIRVQNILGKIVFRQTLTTKKGKNSVIFHKNNLNNGVYLYSIQSSNRIITKRFVIQ